MLHRKQHEAPATERLSPLRKSTYHDRLGNVPLPELGLRLCALLSVMGAFGCTTLRFVAQAAAGQWEISSAARPIPHVLADPETPPLTRKLLSEVSYVRRFARENGLHVSGNYQHYVQLDRKYPIWFVNASHPLAFRARTFSFPIIGSFPGLAWFDEADAREFHDALARQGYDVSMRGVSAFSTGGWFDDPIVWSMLSKSPLATPSLVNTVLHESLHATVLIRDQQYFNESLASFVANTMTGQYLQRRTGERVPQALRGYLASRARGRKRAQVFNDTYKRLDAIYRSERSAADKRREKRIVIDELVRRLRLKRRPNNATLIGFRLYQVARDDFSALYAACDYNWRRFLTAVSSLSSDDFGERQRAAFGPVVDALRQRGCPHELYAIDTAGAPGRRYSTKQRRRLSALRPSERRLVARRLEMRRTGETRSPARP